MLVFKCSSVCIITWNEHISAKVQSPSICTQFLTAILKQLEYGMLRSKAKTSKVNQ